VLGIDQVDLVGHDWGCFVGYRAALEQPERFRRFVAMSATGTAHALHAAGSRLALALLVLAAARRAGGRPADRPRPRVPPLARGPLDRTTPHDA
jgi:pimeloyl-ACP methyl ester carboxylesterase